jgi:hypothetical protein
MPSTARKLSVRFAIVPVGLVLGVAGIVIAVSAGTAAVAGSAPTPVRLIDEFYSYQTTEQVRKTLEKGSLAWRVEREEQRPRGRGKDYHFVALKVSRFTHIGHVGELSLWLFNDRLFQTIFTTPDLETYIRELEVKESTVFDRPGVSEGVRLARTKEPLELLVNRSPPIPPPFVTWIDRRLYQEWIASISN